MAQVTITHEVSFAFDGSSGTSSSFTLGSTDDLIVVAYLDVTDAGKEILGIDWDLATPEALTAFTPHFNPSSGKLRQEIWYKDNPTAGTDTVTITIAGGNAQKVHAHVFSVQNGNVTGLKDRAIQNGTADSGQVTLGAAQAADDLGVVSAAIYTTSGTITWDGGETALAGQLSDFWLSEIAHEDGTTATVFDWSNTGNSADRSTICFTIPVAAGGPKTGTATSSVVVTTSATGQKTGKGTATSSVVTTIAPTGLRTAKGTATSAAAVTVGGITTQRTAKGTATSSATVALTATGAKAGTASSAVAIAVSATGEKTGKGTGSSSVVVSVTATGVKVGAKTGTATSAITVAVTATGAKTGKATASLSSVVSVGGITTLRTGKATATSAVAVTIAVSGERLVEQPASKKSAPEGFLGIYKHPKQRTISPPQEVLAFIRNNPQLFAQIVYNYLHNDSSGDIRFPLQTGDIRFPSQKNT